MASTLDSNRVVQPGLSPGSAHLFCVLGQDSASLHTGIQMGTCEFNGWGNPVVD